MPLDGGDDRLAQAKATGSHRSVTVRLHPVGTLAAGHGLEIGAGAEGPAFTVEHGDGELIVLLEGPEGIGEGRGGFTVDGVASIGAVDPHAQDRTPAFPCH